MSHKALILLAAFCACPTFAGNTSDLQHEINQLKKQTKTLEAQINDLKKRAMNMSVQKTGHSSVSHAHQEPKPSKVIKHKTIVIHHHHVLNTTTEGKVPSQPKTDGPHNFDDPSVHVHTKHMESRSFSYFPTALMADNQVITYIAGTPVVISPYTGARPSFDGSDYIVNISSINRDIRLMEQRRRVYDAYEQIGYKKPDVPIVALSGKVEPIADVTTPYFNATRGNLTLGSSELDIAALMNDKVEAFLALAYDESPPFVGGPRLSNSRFYLNQGFVNIGDLDVTPIYFTAGQIYVPFGRYSSSMVSAPLTLMLARTKARPIILGYKSQTEAGPFASVYGFKSDTTGSHSGIAGANLGYILKVGEIRGEIGASYIGTLTNAGGMQITGSAPGTTFGGFGSTTNGTEDVNNVPGAGVHAALNIDRYSLTAEWVAATKSFRAQDLSFNGEGAKPQALQLEAGATFMAFSKPSSLSLGYQWSEDALALNLPKQRIAGVFNISIWKDTVESLEYRHDIDYSSHDYANGAAPSGMVNQNTVGTGRTADTLVAQIGVYF